MFVRSVGVVCRGGAGGDGWLGVVEDSLETGTSSLEVTDCSLDGIVSGTDAVWLSISATEPLDKIASIGGCKMFVKTVYS